MSKYQSVFEKVGSAKALNNWQPNLPEGNHRVALVKYGAKQSQKDKTVFLEAEFVILATENPTVKVGARYSWPWFINKPDEWGYTHSRAKNFLEVLQRCIGNEEDTTSFGNALAEDFDGAAPRAYGMSLDVEVKKVTNAAGVPSRGKKGNEIFNATWLPIGQDEAGIAATASRIGEMGVVKPDAPEPAKVSMPVTGKKLGGVLTLIGKNQ